jgi:hypothetical protein
MTNTFSLLICLKQPSNLAKPIRVSDAVASQVNGRKQTCFFVELLGVNFPRIKEVKPNEYSSCDRI